MACKIKIPENLEFYSADDYSRIISENKKYIEEEGDLYPDMERAFQEELEKQRDMSKVAEQ